MEKEVRTAVADAFARHGVTDLWMIHDEDFPSEAVFMVRDDEYALAHGNATLMREVAALLPDTKLGVIRYAAHAPARRLLRRTPGVERSS